MTEKTLEAYPELNQQQANSRMRNTLYVLGKTGGINRRPNGSRPTKEIKNGNLQKNKKEVIEIDKLTKSESYNKDGSSTLERIISI